MITVWRGKKKTSFGYTSKPFFKWGVEVWHLGAVCEQGQCPQLGDLSEMSWKRHRFKPQVRMWVWKEGFSKTSCCFPRATGSGKMASIDCTIHWCKNRCRIWWHSSKSPKVHGEPADLGGGFASGPEIRCHVGSHRQIHEAKQTDIAVHIWNNSHDFPAFMLQIFLGNQLAGFSQSQSANSGKET